MNNTEIYYLSGSGNSFAVARDLARELDAKLIPIASNWGTDTINTDAGSIGFVFPLNDFKPPKLYEDLVLRFRNLASKYIFAVCTYGIAASGSLKYFDRLLKQNGGELAGGFAVAMPHNGIGSAVVNPKNLDTFYGDWKSRIDEIREYVRTRRTGKIESGGLPLRVLRFRYLKSIPTISRFLLRLIFRGVDSVNYTASDDCNACGICERVCPADNIKMADEKPVWGDNCTGCFACIHWCPKQAVSLGGLNLNIAAYHHPEVKLSDMLR